MDDDEERPLIMDSLQTALAQGAADKEDEFVLEQEDELLGGEYTATPSMVLFDQSVSSAPVSRMHTSASLRNYASSSFSRQQSLEAVDEKMPMAPSASSLSREQSAEAPRKYSGASATGSLRKNTSVWFSEEPTKEESPKADDLGINPFAIDPGINPFAMKRQQKLMEDLQDHDNEKVMADGPWQCKQPRLRFNQQKETLKNGHGVITREEALWIVLVTLGLAKNRQEIETNHDVVAYILQFFILWTVLYSCILYSARFNDRDFFHCNFWIGILLGFMFLIGCLDEGAPRTVGYSAAFLHMLVCYANARVAYYLKEARFYCSWMAGQSFANSMLMLSLAFVTTGATYEILLWINVFLQPLMYTVYKGIIWSLDILYPRDGERSPVNRNFHSGESGLHVPADFSYINNRWQSVHVLAIVGGFLTSISEYGGQAISISVSSRYIAICTLIFALTLKTSILDVDVASKSGADSLRHPYRRGYVYSRLFLLMFPYSVLCVALTGMGFYIMTLDAAGLAPVVPGSSGEDFSRKLISICPACAWFVLTTNKAITKPRVASIHWTKVAVLYFLAASFLVPAMLEFSRVCSAIWVTVVQLFILLSMLLAMYYEKEHGELNSRHSPMRRVPSEYGTWRMAEPKLLLEWEQFDANKLVGVQTDAHELFSTVLIAVSLMTMTTAMENSNSIEGQYALCFVTMYVSFSFLMRYSSRFAMKDLTHRMAWSGYQFLMLLQIIAMKAGTTTAAANTTTQAATMTAAATTPTQAATMTAAATTTIQANMRTLFAVASAIQFVWVGIAFWLRITWLPRGRPYAFYCITSCFILAMISSVPIFTASSITVWPMLGGLIVFGLFNETLFNVGTWFLVNPSKRRAILLPMNVEYLQNRINGTFITIISLCIIKCGASSFWGTYLHPGLAAIGVAMIGLIAMSVMSSHFHTDLVSAKRHALHRGEVAGQLFLLLHPCILVLMALIGASAFMCMEAVGQYGDLAYSSFPKHILCISTAAFKFMTVAMKRLHLPRDDIKKFEKFEQQVGEMKGGLSGLSFEGLRLKITIFSCLLCLLPLPFSSMGDLSTLIFIAAVMVVTRYLQILVNYMVDMAKKKIKEKARELSLKLKNPELREEMRRNSSNYLT